MAEFNEYLFDNEESDDERASREKKDLAAVDSWFGIANSTGIHIMLFCYIVLFYLYQVMDSKL